MSHHLLRNQNGHLLRVDHRVYEQGYVLDLPTHLLRGTDKQAILTSQRMWPISASVTNGSSNYNYTTSLPSFAQVTSSLESGYSTNAPSAYWVGSRGSRWASGSCASANVWNADIGRGLEYRYNFSITARFYNFNWPTGFHEVPAISFTANATFLNRGLSSVCFRAFACDSVRIGGTSTQPHYRFNPTPATLADLDALPGGYVMQANSSIPDTQIVIYGPFEKKEYLTVVAYPEDFAVPYQNPPPQSGQEAHFEGYANVEVLTSSNSAPTAWVIG